MANRSDRQLVEEAGKGATWAFEELVDRHYRAVYGVALSTVGRHEAAEDLAQEAFLMAWRHLDRLRNPRAFALWVRAIVRNLAKSWLRSTAARRRLLERYAEAGNGEETAAGQRTASAEQRVGSAEQRIEADERMRVVWDALAALTPKLRETLVLFYLEGRSVAETARALGIGENAVKVRLYQGRRKLRAHMAETMEEALAQHAGEVALDGAKRRIMTGLAVGPALGNLAPPLPGSGLTLLIRHILREGVTATMGSSWLITGGLAVNTKAIAVGILALLALLALPLLRSGDSPPSDQDVTTPVSSEDTPAPPAAKGVISPSSRAANSTAEKMDGPPADAGDPTGTARSTAVCSLSGHVYRKTGQGIAGATVLAMDGRMARPSVLLGLELDGQALAPQRTTTDSRGAFAFDGLPAWYQVKVAVQADGYETQERRVDVAPNKSRDGVDFHLHSGGIMLKGRVLSPSGSPVPNALVRTIGGGWTASSSSKSGPFPGAMSMRGGSARTRSSTYTDERGEFGLAFIDPYAGPGVTSTGTAMLLVETAQYGWASFDGIVVRERDPVTLRMPRAAQISGRVMLAADTPPTDLHVEAVWPMWSEIEGAGGGADYLVGASAVNAHGQYAIKGVQPGAPLVLTVVRPDGQRASQPAQLPPLRTGEARKYDFDLRSIIRLHGKLLGIFLGSPIQDGAIAYVDADGQADQVRVDRDGAYEILLAKPGTYLVCPLYAGNRLTDEALEGADEVTVQRGDDLLLDFELPPTYTLSARVVDPGGNPIPGATVMASWFFKEHFTKGCGLREKTDSQGRITWAGFPPASTGSLRFTKEGYQFTEGPGHLGQSGDVFEEDTITMRRQ